MHKHRTSDEVSFGQLVGSYRTLRTRLSQHALADFLGVSEVTLRSWETDQSKPEAKNLQKLLEVFLEQGIFKARKEEEEARALWSASKVNIVFDEVWVNALTGARKSKSEKKGQVASTDSQSFKLSGPRGADRDIQKVGRSETSRANSPLDIASPISEEMAEDLSFLDTKEDKRNTGTEAPTPLADTEEMTVETLLQLIAVRSSETQVLVKRLQSELRIIPVQSKSVTSQWFHDTITESGLSSTLSGSNIQDILSVLHESGDLSMLFDQSKRETLQKIATSLLIATGFSQVETFTILNAKQQGLLALSGRTSPVSPEVLDRFEQLIEHCWQLSKGKRQDIALAKTTAALCLPTLTATAEQPSIQQRRAADLAAQLYRLSTILGYHTENLFIAEVHAQNAVKYSKIADNLDLLVASLSTLALVFHYANRPEQGIEQCLEAEQYLDRTTYAVRSLLYRRKSVCLGQLGLYDEALATFDLALNTFDLQQLSNEIPPSYAEHHASANKMEILLWEGITRYQVGQQDAAIVALEQLNPHEPSSIFPERIRTGFLNNLVFAELSKPAQQRDLSKCKTLWQEAAQAALDLQSELRYGEVMRAYNELLIAFPGETGLKTLRRTIKRNATA